MKHGSEEALPCASGTKLLRRSSGFYAGVRTLLEAKRNVMLDNAEKRRKSKGVRNLRRLRSMAAGILLNPYAARQIRMCDAKLNTRKRKAD